MISAAQLRQFAPHCDADKLAPILDAELQRGKITTSLRIGHFLAQTAEETGGFTVFAENLNYSAERLLQVFPTHFNATTAAIYARQPERIANHVYAGRFGNGGEASGDGWKYRGRGEMQVTFRDNYARLGAETGQDLVNHPELLEDPRGGIIAAVDFWDDHGLNQDADLNDIVLITRRVNGGLNGLPGRKAWFNAAREIWTDAAVAIVAPPAAPVPAPVMAPPAAAPAAVITDAEAIVLFAQALVAGVGWVVTWIVGHLKGSR